jgi:hypothetical protein
MNDFALCELLKRKPKRSTTTGYFLLIGCSLQVETAGFGWHGDFKYDGTFFCLEGLLSDVSGVRSRSVIVEDVAGGGGRD